MLNFSYTLDSELTAPVGQLPSGVQVQAFGLALTRMSERFRDSVRVLQMPVGPLKVGPIAGMQPVWRARLKTEIAFMRKLPDRLIAVAQNVATYGIANAVDQGRLDSQWNRWSKQALDTYNEALAAFQNEMSAALRNAPVSGTPAVMVKVANIAKMPPPSMPDANATLGGYPVDDPAYLAGFIEDNKTLLGVGALGLAAAWWFMRDTYSDSYAMVPPPRPHPYAANMIRVQSRRR